MSVGLTSLFIGSFLASTLMPGGVEVLLYYLYQSGNYTVASLLAVSTIGNSLGGFMTFFMGDILRRGLSKANWYERIQRLFKLEGKALARIRKWGVPALFFTWMPIVGDPLALAGGYLQLPLWRSLIWIFVGKFVRYGVLIWLFAQPWFMPPM